MTTATYAVTGMVCRHCASFVTEEIERLGGVSAVTVDIENGTVTVTSDHPLDSSDMRVAVEEAGYDLLTQAHHPRRLTARRC